MSYYNTYRPSIFSEIDSQKTLEILTSLLSKPKDELPHAYLFIGPRGVGKTTTARLVAKLFNCLKPKKNGEPCGNCTNCQATANGTSFDVQEIDAASNTGVDNIRDLKEKIAVSPVAAKYKVYIIDEVHMLSTGAFNALLKTLEEPPKHAVFILATTEGHKVPETIQSRCLIINFTKPSKEEITQALKRVISNEHLTVTPEAEDAIIRSANGSFRDAVKLLEQASLISKVVTLAEIEKATGTFGPNVTAELAQIIATKDITAVLTQLEMMKKNAVNFREMYQELLSFTERELTATILGTPRILSTPQSELEQLAQHLLNQANAIRNASVPELPLELALIGFCRQSTSQPAEPPNYVAPPKVQAAKRESTTPTSPSLNGNGVNLSLAKLTEHWNDIVTAVKSHNHTISGVLRSARPMKVEHDIVTIETAYPFHQEKLSEPKAKDAIASTIKELFGASVAIDITRKAKKE